MPSKNKRARNQRNKKQSQTCDPVDIQLNNQVNNQVNTKPEEPEEPVEDFVYSLSIMRQKKPIWLVREIKKILPYHIVRYICLLCMILNEGKWEKTHKKHSKKYHDILSNVITLGMNEKVDYGSEKMYISPRYENPMPFFMVRKPCLKHKEKYLVDGEITKGTSIIHLPRQAAESFWIEESDIKEGYKGQRSRKTYNYLVHNKCRCYNCDMVRCSAVTNGINFEKYSKYYKMYKYLNFDLENEQWHHRRARRMP